MLFFLCLVISDENEELMGLGKHTDEGIWGGKNRAVDVIEAVCDFARKFKMLLLVFSDRDVCCPGLTFGSAFSSHRGTCSVIVRMDQHVCRLQHWVRK